MDTSDEELRDRAVVLVADWVATLFRPYPSTADLDRLTESVLSAVIARVSAAEGRLESTVAAVERAARDFHDQAHEGAFADCRRPPCGQIRDALQISARVS